MKKITKLRRSVKAISPVISVLLMIAIAVAASLVAYAWVMGYMDFTTAKVGKQIQIQSISSDSVYVQNIGDSDVTLKEMYVNDNLVVANFSLSILPVGETSTVKTTDVSWVNASRVRIKVVTVDGIQAVSTETFSGATGDGSDSGAIPTVFLEDDFNRANSLTVGGGWVEHESNPAEEAQILNGRLDFDSVDAGANEPRVYQTFTQITSGQIKWTFTFNFERTGGELTYRAYMQLGDGLTGNPAGDASSVAVNLKWAGINDGMTNQEGFGYENGGVTQVGVVSGSGGDATITVIVDLDTNTYDLSVTGAGLISGTGTASGVAFNNDVNIDSVRIIIDSLNDGNFGDLEIDNMQIVEILP